MTIKTIQINAFIITLAIFTNIGCSNIRCKNAREEAKMKSKDPALFYLWRYSNSMLSHMPGAKADSGYYSFKPNGDFSKVPGIKEVNNWANVWYVNSNTISTTYCLDQVPDENNPAYKYLIRKDTLFLYQYDSYKKTFWPKPDTLIKFKKY